MGLGELPSPEAARALLLKAAGNPGEAEAQLKLLRRLHEFPESFLPLASQQRHHQPHHHHHLEEREASSDGGETQKLIAALLPLVASPSSKSPASVELRVHAALALATLLVLAPAQANVCSDDDGSQVTAAPFTRALSQTASTLLQLAASSQHQQPKRQQKRGGAERAATVSAPLRRVALECLGELEAAFPGLLWEEREQLKVLVSGATVAAAPLLALVLENGTAAGAGNAVGIAESRASIAAVLDRLPLLSPPHQLLTAQRLAAAAGAAHAPPVVFKPQLLRLMALVETPAVAAALLLKRAFGDALFAPDEEALLARRLAAVGAHPCARAGTRLLVSRWLLRFPENSPLHDDDEGGACCGWGGGGDGASVSGTHSRRDCVGSDTSGGGDAGGVGDGTFAGVAVDGASCGGCCRGAGGGGARAPLSLTPAIATTLFPTIFQGCPPLFPSPASSAPADGACATALLLSRFQLLCLVHCDDDDFGEAGASEGAIRLLGCLRAMATDLRRRSRHQDQQQQEVRRRRRRRRRAVACPFFGAALLFFRHFRGSSPALAGLCQLLVDTFLEDVRLSVRLVRLVDHMQCEEEAAATQAAPESLSSSMLSLASATPAPKLAPGASGSGSLSFPALLLRSLQEVIVDGTASDRWPQRERLSHELPVLERAAREPHVPAAPVLAFLLRLVSTAGSPLGDWESGCGILAVCRHLLARPGAGAADPVVAPLLSRLLLTLAQAPACDLDVRDRARALAGLQAALSPAKLRALLTTPATGAPARCNRHHAAPVPALPLEEVPRAVSLAEPALLLSLVDPDEDDADADGGTDASDASDINEDEALPVYLRWLRGDGGKNSSNDGAGESWGRPDEAPLSLRVTLCDDWSRRHGWVYAVRLRLGAACTHDVRLPCLGGGGGAGARTARIRLSPARGANWYRDVPLSPTAVFSDSLGRTCHCRLPALPVPLASLLRPLAPALTPHARSRLFEELWALFASAAATAAAADDSSNLTDGAGDLAACAESVLCLGGGDDGGEEAIVAKLRQGLRRFLLPPAPGDAAGDPRPFRAAVTLPPGRHWLLRIAPAAGDGRARRDGTAATPVPVAAAAPVRVAVATDDWKLLPVIGSHVRGMVAAAS